MRGASQTTMIGIDEMRHAAGSTASELAMVSVTQTVPCERCGRTVRVTLNALRPPSFQRVDEQIECPEIQQRRNSDDGGLLLMMCPPLQHSLESRCATASVEAATDGGAAGRIVCSIPGVSTEQYSAAEARNVAEIWQTHGQDDLASKLRSAASRAERGPLVSPRAAAGLAAFVLIAIAGWFMLARGPGSPLPEPASQQQAVQTPEPAASRTSIAVSESPAPPQPVAPTPEPTPALLQGGLPDAATRSSPTETMQSPAPELQAAAVVSPPKAAPSLTDSDMAAEPSMRSTNRLPDMVMIPGNTFAMGGLESAELPVHRVTIAPFALGKYPVTVGEWNACVTDKACADLATGPEDNPVTNVSYYDAKDYLAWLSRTSGKPFRLPSEAEWEYAARGGAATKFWWGDQMRPGMANCDGCNGTGEPARLVKVGSFQANPFGLFDMGGSVDQWVADSWHKNYQGAPSNGAAWVDEQSFVRVIRSGSWKNDASYVRSGSRDRYDGRVRYPTHGFRVAQSL